MCNATVELSPNILGRRHTHESFFSLYDATRRSATEKIIRHSLGYQSRRKRVIFCVRSEM